MKIEYLNNKYMKFKDLKIGDVWRFPGSDRIWLKIKYDTAFCLNMLKEEDFGADVEVEKLDCKLVIL